MTLWVAVPVSVLGNFLNSVGYIIQKKGHNAVVLEPNDDGSVNSYTKSKTWRLGFLVYVIGSLLHGYALSQGSQSLITPLESVTLIANTFLCPIFLGEQLRRIDIIGTIIILCGCTLAVVFGPTSDEEYTADDLISLYIEKAFITLCCVIFFFFLLDYAGVRYVEKKCKNQGIVQDGSMKVYGAGFLCISYSSIGALAGSYNVLFTKSVFEMLSLTFGGENQLGVPWFWVLIVMFALGNVALEYWKQKALGIYGALYVVPIYQVIVIIGGIIVGAVYFKEFATLDQTSAIMFGLAILCTVSGVYLLSLSEAQKSKGLKALITRKILPLIKITRAFGSRTRSAGAAILEKLRRNKSESQRMSVAFSSVSGWGQLFQKLNFVRMIRERISRSRAARMESRNASVDNGPLSQHSTSVTNAPSLTGDQGQGGGRESLPARDIGRRDSESKHVRVHDGRTDILPALQEATPLLSTEAKDDALAPDVVRPVSMPEAALGGDEKMPTVNEGQVASGGEDADADAHVPVPTATKQGLELEDDEEARIASESTTSLPKFHGARRETLITSTTNTLTSL